MDSDEAYTPRSGRKKKSTLSKLAARGRRRAEEESEGETSSSIPNGGVSHQHRPTPKYPIDANVEIRENAQENEEDSDEGIEVVNDKFSYLDHRFNNSLGAANDTGQASFSSQTRNDDPNSRDRTDANHNTSKMDTGFDTYKRQEGGGFSLRNDPLGSPSKLPKSLEQQHLAMSDPEDLVDHRTSHLSDEASGSVLKVREALESESLSYVDVPKSTLKSTKEELKEQLTNSNSSPFRSNLVRGASMSRSDENLTTLYRESLQQKEKEADHAEQDELADNVSALRQGMNRTMLSSTQKSATAQSLYSSHDRTWGSLGKFGGGGYDTMSQRSFQSTSVLPLITTKEARNRSFLVGSMSGRAALMGLEEMERFFPDHKMRVFSGTWNMYDMKLLPNSLDDWLLPDTSDYIQDMYVIGTQESCPNRREWEIRLQETLGPSHVLFHTAVHGVLYLVVFLRRDLIWFCSVTEEANVQTRLGPSNIATKGAVALCFTFFGTSFLLVNSHLAPHDGKVKERIADYNKITSNLNLPTIVLTNPYSSSQASLDNLRRPDDATARFDCVFWMGDLNFRLEKERERVDKAMDALNSQEIPSYEDLMRHDELFRVRNEGLAFQDFQEGRIKFKPTYKFDKGTDNYDTSKKLRIPSYTDRILFRSRKKNSISCLFYDSVNSLKDSDHKPVYAMFEVLIRPGKDNIPLSAGQFNREVWLEGNRRRAERLASQKQRSKASSVCSLQ